jgi:hypothetical protein
VTIITRINLNVLIISDEWHINEREFSKLSCSMWFLNTCDENGFEKELQKRNENPLLKKNHDDGLQTSSP